MNITAQETLARIERAMLKAENALYASRAVPLVTQYPATRQKRLGDGRIFKTICPPNLPTMTMHDTQLNDLKQFILRPRRDWPLAFGANPKNHQWPFRTYGYTDPEERAMVAHPVLREIVSHFLATRSAGGRVFIDQEGVFHKSTARPDLLFQFVQFVLLPASWRGRVIYP